MANLFDPPAKYVLPLSKGRDLIVNFKNKPGGVYTAWAVGVAVKLVIDAATPIVAVAVIDGYVAQCRVKSETADLARDKNLWRCVVSYPGGPDTEDPTTDAVAMNGVVGRFDGN